jgi:transcriptional antiterminator
MTQLNFESLPGWKMTHIEKSIWELIKCRTAKDPITTKEIAQTLRIDERTVRHTVKILIEVFKKAIGSKTANPPGYYRISSQDQAEKTYQSLRRRGLSILARAAEIKRISLRELLGQLLIEFKE